MLCCFIKRYRKTQVCSCVVTECQQIITWGFNLWRKYTYLQNIPCTDTSRKQCSIGRTTGQEYYLHLVLTYIRRMEYIRGCVKAICKLGAPCPSLRCVVSTAMAPPSAPADHILRRCHHRRQRLQCSAK